MYSLKIYDHQGQTHAWWFNFLMSCETKAEIEVELAKYDCRVTTGNVFSDTLIFGSEQTRTLFLLKWSH